MFLSYIKNQKNIFNSLFKQRKFKILAKFYFLVTLIYSITCFQTDSTTCLLAESRSSKNEFPKRSLFLHRIFWSCIVSQTAVKTTSKTVSILLHSTERKPETFNVEVGAARLGRPGIEPVDDDIAIEPAAAVIDDKAVSFATATIRCTSISSTTFERTSLTFLTTLSSILVWSTPRLKYTWNTIEMIMPTKK